MKPILYTKTSNELTQCSIISCISAIECKGTFLSLLGASQSEQKKIVGCFQKQVYAQLESAISVIKWTMEYRSCCNSKDSIDIFGEGADYAVVIELDKHRADQVAKKFVSRLASIKSNPLFFISLCYPGTPAMNKSECVKYFGYCATLASRMGNHYAGFIIE